MTEAKAKSQRHMFLFLSAVGAFLYVASFLAGGSISSAPIEPTAATYSTRADDWAERDRVRRRNGAFHRMEVALKRMTEIHDQHQNYHDRNDPLSSSQLDDVNYEFGSLQQQFNAAESEYNRLK